MHYLLSTGTTDTYEKHTVTTHTDRPNTTHHCIDNITKSHHILTNEFHTVTNTTIISEDTTTQNTDLIHVKSDKSTICFHFFTLLAMPIFIIPCACFYVHRKNSDK